MNLSYGMRGPAVTKLQGWLNATGIALIDMDGVFGPNTLGAVKEFQAWAGLKVDGIVGQQTIAALANALRMSIGFTQAELAQTGMSSPSAPPAPDAPSAPSSGKMGWAFAAGALVVGWLLM